jgi:hypothetical protein
MAANLDSDPSPAEFHAIKRKLPHGKVPGPDRLPYEFYISNWSSIVPILMKLTLLTMRSAQCPSSFHHAHITAKYKEKGDKTLPSNYRPLSLTNCDYKILAKFFALRMSRVLPHLIHSDQTAFIPQRHISASVLTLKLLTEFSHLSNSPLIICLCDFAKAYDSADRSFIYSTLKHLQFPSSFLNAFTAFHSSTTAQVLINGRPSHLFPILSGVRQGCPWAPMLFILMMESFAQAIRADPRIHPFHIPSHNNIPAVNAKYIAYADDTSISTSSLLSLKQFAHISSKFKLASGELLNPPKCRILLSSHFSHADHISISQDWPSTPILSISDPIVHLG